MELIRQKVEGIAQTILELTKHTQQIGGIVNTVNDLAERSKLLALNASIEASHAGEQGKGFAIVAMEVRKLAEQSHEATMRVREILGEILNATNSAVAVTEEGSQGAKNGMQLVEHAGNVIQELTATIESAAQAAQQIVASSQQQFNGMEQLKSAMLQIRQASDQTTASMEQAARSIQDLTKMADQLSDTAAQHQVIDD
jgi:methyl-accepting chemotaxis protein